MLKSKAQGQVFIPRLWCKPKRGHSDPVSSNTAFARTLPVSCHGKCWECQNFSPYILFWTLFYCRHNIIIRGFCLLLTFLSLVFKEPQRCLVCTRECLRSDSPLPGFCHPLFYSLSSPTPPSRFHCPVAQRKGWSRLTCQLYLYFRVFLGNWFALSMLAGYEALCFFWWFFYSFFPHWNYKNITK